MQVLAIENELKPLDAERDGELLRDEAAVVWDLQKDGVIRGLWFTCRDRSAVVLLEVATEEEARQRLGSLPLVRAGFIAFEVLALRSYDGFDRLIDRQLNLPNKLGDGMILAGTSAAGQPRAPASVPSPL